MAMYWAGVTLAPAEKLCSVSPSVIETVLVLEKRFVPSTMAAVVEDRSKLYA
jgi:hypothetical protein